MRSRLLDPLGSRAPFATALAIATIALGLSSPGAAHAAITSISVSPEAPLSCDSTTIHVDGNLASSCERLFRWSLSGPTPENVGGVLVQRFDATVVVQEPNPQLMMPCGNDDPPYSVALPAGLLPPGPYAVRAVEYRVPYFSSVPDDSSFFAFRFGVAPGDSCASGPPCVLLDFIPAEGSIVPPAPTSDRLVACDAQTPPGGTGCFAVGLQNPVPVGGVQVSFSIADPTAGPLPAGTFTPISVATTARSKDFTVSWTADGATVKAILYSTSGATIAPGHGPILRACYAVSADTREMPFPIFFSSMLVVDARGVEIASCPTFAQIQGWFCVGRPSSCDLNGDGRSDIRDVIRLVRCALAGAGSDACPDSVAARADCNGDGAIDVRDVVCCVRGILASALEPPPAGGSGAAPIRVGFTGPAVWTDGADGKALLEIAPGADFAGAQFEVAPGAGIRIRNVSLDAAAAGVSLQWATGPDGVARVLLYGTAGPAAPTGTASGAAVQPIAVAVGIEPAEGTESPASTLSVRSIGGATWDGAAATAEATRPTADVPATAVPAPAVYPARPNPFAGDTELSYALARAGRVSLRLYDVSGRLVRTLVDGPRDAGIHRVRWDGRNDAGAAVVSGIYFVKFTAGGTERTDRVLKLR